MSLPRTPPTFAHALAEWSYNGNSGCWYIEIRDADLNHADAQVACQQYEFEGHQAHLAAPTNRADAEFIGALGEVAKPAWNAGKWNGTHWNYVDGSSFNVFAWNGW
jgi:hypothetical protein